MGATKEELYKLVWIDNMSYISIGKIYGVTCTSVKRWMKKFGIDFPDRGSPQAPIRLKKIRTCTYCNKDYILGKNATGKYCSKLCSNLGSSKKTYERYLADNSIAFGFTNMSSYKKHFLEDQNFKCDICGLTNEWNGKLLVFVLDHIDGCSDNNNRNNLRLVCPNCDSQLDTYKSKNKNSDRAKYRKVIRVSERV